MDMYLLNADRENMSFLGNLKKAYPKVKEPTLNKCLFGRN